MKHLEDSGMPVLYRGRTVLEEALSRLPFNAEVHVRFQFHACEFGGVNCGIGKGFALNTSDFLST
jgi:hypothetical protein